MIGGRCVMCNKMCKTCDENDPDKCLSCDSSAIDNGDNTCSCVGSKYMV